MVVHMHIGHGYPETNLRRIRGCAAVLTTLHARGVVHATLSRDCLPVFLDGAVPAGYVSLLSKLQSRRKSLVYMAPELLYSSALGGPAPPSPSSDVYAWAIAAWSALTGRDPIFDDDELVGEIDEEKRAQRILSGVRPPLDHWMVPRIRPPRLDLLMLACWASDPHMRPSASHVVAEMDAILISPGVDWMDIQTP